MERGQIMVGPVGADWDVEQFAHIGHTTDDGLTYASEPDVDDLFELQIRVQSPVVVSTGRVDKEALDLYVGTSETAGPRRRFRLTFAHPDDGSVWCADELRSWIGQRVALQFMAGSEPLLPPGTLCEIVSADVTDDGRQVQLLVEQR